LVGTRLEFGFEQELLLLERDDLPFGADHFAPYRVHFQVQHQVQCRANGQCGDPADAANAAVARHAASLAWAAVRLAQRRVAERARGLRRISASDGRIGFATSAKVGSRAAGASGKCRLERGVLPAASRRKRLTMRSSRLCKLTTARRPPALSTRSAALRPCSSSSSSPLTWMRIAWKLRVAGSFGAPAR